MNTNDYHAAAASFAEIDGRLKALGAAIDARRLALQLAPDDEATSRTPGALWSLAKPHLTAARRRPAKVADEIANLELEAHDLVLPHRQAKDAMDLAARQETDQIAIVLQPRHRAVVKKLVSAAEAFSMALAAERAIRFELRRQAPWPTSGFLPDVTEGLVGIDEPGPLRDFARRVRASRIFSS